MVQQRRESTPKGLFFRLRSVTSGKKRFFSETSIFIKPPEKGEKVHRREKRRPWIIETKAGSNSTKITTRGGFFITLPHEK